MYIKAFERKLADVLDFFIKLGQSLNTQRRVQDHHKPASCQRHYNYGTEVAAPVHGPHHKGSTESKGGGQETKRTAQSASKVCRKRS